jgi:hypothetical protein
MRKDFMGMGCSGRWCGAGVLHLLLLLSLVGCGSMADRAPTATSEPMRILDPVVAFAADPSVNGEAQVVLPDTGESVRLRLVRQYAAASGRECREVRVAYRSGEQNRLFCRAGTGWIEARQLVSQSDAR